MKHPSIRALFDYWNGRRGWRAAPERRDIDPDAIRHVLADTFILALDPSAGHPFRVAGTRVCALFGHELKGTAFLDRWTLQSRERVNDLVKVMADETIGAVASAAGTIRGEAALELLLLPLTYRERSDTRILGALAISPVAEWRGPEPLGALALGGFRYVIPDEASGSEPHPAFHSPRGRLRRGLVVYDGGQT